ncbi:MAG: cytochrome c biogenesis protein CcdA [Deltaproteobacteria bacterium]|nr:cytochrome c biogenesis protein CcdA [Deltaproteobacteria bacterium]MBW2398022.1 cytochrome c biogenesis protein CcdA [Deltaproteobacteria bacterium]MBW2665531.1 cytochrome c biogenesis protein CcdA [Deltaproteobacteria bacterium]
MIELGSHGYLAFAAGLLSVLSPCVLPLMPAYLSLISGISVEEMREGADDARMRSQVMRACFGFVSGFSIVFVILGVGAVAAGQIIRTWQMQVFGIGIGISQIAGVVIILFGLHMTGLIPIRALYRDTRFQFQINHHSFVSSLLIGAGFALGWSPCIGPILATILTLAGSQETMMQGVGLLLIYSGGLAVPFLIAGWSIEYFFEAFHRIKHHFRVFEIVSGLILVAVGALLVTDRLTLLNRQFQFMSEWVNTIENALQ